MAIWREFSNIPGDWSVIQEQFGIRPFLSYCCISTLPFGNVAESERGCLPPYLDGREMDLPTALPLGIVAGTDRHHLEEIATDLTGRQVGALDVKGGNGVYRSGKMTCCTSLPHSDGP